MKKASFGDLLKYATPYVPFSKVMYVWIMFVILP